MLTVLKTFSRFIKEINMTPDNLENIQCFYNFKPYSISIMRSGKPSIRLEPNQEVIGKDGKYVVNEELLKYSTQNMLGRRMKTQLDNMIQEEQDIPDVKDSLEIESVETESVETPPEEDKSIPEAPVELTEPSTEEKAPAEKVTKVVPKKTIKKK